MVRKPNMKVRPNHHIKHPTHILTNIQWAKDEEHQVNEDGTDESQKVQLNFEYDVHLLNYTIQIKT